LIQRGWALKGFPPFFILRAGSYNSAGFDGWRKWKNAHESVQGTNERFSI
jgi:hypothetical protein